MLGSAGVPGCPSRGVILAGCWEPSDVHGPSRAGLGKLFCRNYLKELEVLYQQIFEIMNYKMLHSFKDSRGPKRLTFSS